MSHRRPPGLPAVAGLLCLTLLAGCSVAARAAGAASSATAGPPAQSSTDPAAAQTSPRSAAPGTPPGTAPATRTSLPRPAHTVIVVLENHGYAKVVGDDDAPWLNGLPAAVMTDWHGIAHPSQPNYLALFTGSTHGVTDDHCPVHLTGPSLGGQLVAAGRTFAGYSEGLPAAGSTVCRRSRYARKHNPWVDVRGLPASVNQPLTALPTDFAALPSVAIVVPDLCHDSHDCPTSTADAWVRDTLAGYATWAQTHDSLLVVTYDEEDNEKPANHIPTLLVGPMVRPGRYAERGDHYTMLRTVEALNGLPGIGTAAARTPIADIWR